MPCWQGKQQCQHCSHSICASLGRPWGPFSQGLFWLYPFCDNHRHLSIKRNKFRHYQFVPTFCSSAQTWFSVPEAVQFFVIFKRFYFWPNQHNIVVTVKMRQFYFNIWVWIVFDIVREQIKPFCCCPVKWGGVCWVFFGGGVFLALWFEVFFGHLGL